MTDWYEEYELTGPDDSYHEYELGIWVEEPAEVGHFTFDELAWFTVTDS